MLKARRAHLAVSLQRRSVMETTTKTKKPDFDLRDDVMRELAWEERVDERQIAVQAAGGVITLAGTVGSWAARQAAVEAAHRVAGVLDVANELEVRLPIGGEAGDADLAHAARQALAGDALVPAEQIHVTAEHGRIVLGGTVDTASQRADAERAIERLRGIRHVVNQISVRQSPATGEIAGAIETALARRAARETSHLRLSVADGRVVVEGRVRSTAERRLVLGAIHGTRGVVAVDDRLVVEREA
jgi:osmotically-inducible protein OsmY